MTKKELWELYTKKNPSFDGDGKVTLSAAGLRKMFNQTYGAAHAQGLENGRAIEQMQRRGGVDSDIFKQMFPKF